MKKVVSAALALSIAGSSFAASVKWQPSYDSAVSNAKATHRLLMVDFYTDWCGWCKKLDKDTYESDAVAGRSQAFVPVKVNAEKEGVATAKKYHVTGYPTILFLKPSGEVAWKIVGYMPPADFAKQMDMAQGVETELPKLEAEFHNSGGNAEIDSKLISYYGGMDSLDKIQKVLPSLDRLSSGSPSAQLGSAYNAAGDAYQNAGKNKEAIDLFRKGEMTGKPEQIAYARISMAQCYFALNDPKSAVPVLKAFLSMGPEADSYRKSAEAMLAAATKQKA